MRAIRDIMTTMVTEPVITNAFRQAQGKPAVGREELSTMEQLSNIASSFAMSKNDIIRQPALAARGRKLGLFTTRVGASADVKDTTIFGMTFKIDGLNSVKREVVEIDELTTRIKSLVARIDAGTKVKDIHHEVADVLEASGIMFANLRTLQGEPKDTTSAFEKALHAKLDAMPLAVNRFFDGIDAKIAAFDKARQDKRQAAKQAPTEIVSHAVTRTRVSLPYTAPKTDAVADMVADFEAATAAMPAGLDKEATKAYFINRRSAPKA